MLLYFFSEKSIELHTALKSATKNETPHTSPTNTPTNLSFLNPVIEEVASTIILNRLPQQFL